jgi:preprotein translocase subunit SecG
LFYFILTLHLLLCVGLVFLVLLQQGKGADMGAAFGGNQAMFGPGSAVNTVGRITTGLAVAFMITSIVLVRAYSSVTPTVQVGPTNPLSGSVMEGAVAPVKEAAATPGTVEKKDNESKADAKVAPLPESKEKSAEQPETGAAEKAPQPQDDAGADKPKEAEAQTAK